MELHLTTPNNRLSMRPEYYLSIIIYSVMLGWNTHTHTHIHTHPDRKEKMLLCDVWFYTPLRCIIVWFLSSLFWEVKRTNLLKCGLVKKKILLWLPLAAFVVLLFYVWDEQLGAWLVRQFLTSCLTFKWFLYRIRFSWCWCSLQSYYIGSCLLSLHNTICLVNNLPHLIYFPVET